VLKYLALAIEVNRRAHTSIVDIVLFINLIDLHAINLIRKLVILRYLVDGRGNRFGN
jgi:hypothetical protein